MKITLERFDENFGFKVRAGSHEMILDTAAEIGGNDQGFRPMELMLISQLFVFCQVIRHT